MFKIDALNLSLFFLTFGFMELAAWSLHKYVMHGFLWNLHYDHHNVNKKKWWQLNDAFALFFAIPSFLSILISKIYSISELGAFGFGIMFYGAVYFLVHEVLIHKRLRFSFFKNSRYLKGLKKAHHFHHAVKTKKGAESFGMLVVPWRFFK